MTEVVPQSILLDVAVEHALKRKPKASKPPLKGFSKVLEATKFGRDIIFKKAGEQAQKKAHGNYPAIDKIIQTVREGVERGTISYGKKQSCAAPCKVPREAI